MSILAKKPTKPQTKQRRRPVKNLPPLLAASPASKNAFIQRAPGCACGGECPHCTGEIDLQPKLKIGQPNDKYEKEADRVADQVMRMLEPGIQRQPT